MFLQPRTFTPWWSHHLPQSVVLGPSTLRGSALEQVCVLQRGRSLREKHVGFQLQTTSRLLHKFFIQRDVTSGTHAFLQAWAWRLWCLDLAILCQVPSIMVHFWVTLMTCQTWTILTAVLLFSLSDSVSKEFNVSSAWLDIVTGVFETGEPGEATCCLAFLVCIWLCKMVFKSTWIFTLYFSLLSDPFPELESSVTSYRYEHTNL